MDKKEFIEKQMIEYWVFQTKALDYWQERWRLDHSKIKVIPESMIEFQSSFFTNLNSLVNKL